MDLEAARLLTHELMSELLPLPDFADWRFEYDNAMRRFGSCDYDRSVITLSPTLVQMNSIRKVREIIVHEIAHALAGHGAGHGPRWKAIDLSLGGTGKRCYDQGGAEVVTPIPPFYGTCPNCGHVVTAWRRRKTACKRCCNQYNHGKFDPKYRFRWRRILTQHPPID